MAAVNSGQFERAVRVFDGWSPPDTELTREVRRTIESVRAALKAGRPITLTPPVR